MRVLLLSLFLLTAAAHAKSSEIPDKREFPLSEDLNPCDDFHKYVCTKVEDAFQLRADRSRHQFAFDDSSERLLEYKKKYFSNLAKVKPDTSREQMIKDYYMGCMNAPSRKTEEKKWVSDTKKELAKIKTREELLALLGKNIVAGRESAVDFGTDANQDKPLMNDVFFDVKWMSLPTKEYYEKPEVVAGLEKVITKFFKTVGESDSAKKAKQVVAFEKSLAKEYPTPAEFRDLFSSRTGITRAELSKQFPNLKLDDLLTHVPESTHIRHIMPKAMAALNEKLGSLPLDELKRLYLYNELGHVMDDAYPDYFKTWFAFQNEHLGGPPERPVRNERCTREVMAHFTPELDSTLWPRLFPNFPREKVVSLAERIRGSIVSSLKDNTWLTENAKKEAINKISSADLQLVSPQTDEEWNFNPVAKYDVKQPLHNAQELTRLLNEKSLNELKGPISPKRWGMGPLTVNAYYNPAYNKFVLPVGILQYPFFDVNGKPEDNLAAMGTVIGHELGHSIDDKGSRFDAKGVLRPWMNDADLGEFKKRTALLVEQFDKAGHNGTLTLGENIGDFVGLTASHKAAFGPTYKDENKKAEQDFFVHYARVWCLVILPKQVEMRLKMDPHALGWARINEQIKQQPAFRQAFSCKDGDQMVLPKEKLVKVW